MSPQLPSLKPKEVIRILLAIGFVFHRQKGSHRIYVKEDLMVVVPQHNRDMKKGTLSNIIKGTNLTVEEFLSYR
jgi:predicted RNA binding protein YcfA (HicA-like mRNA interferase family)